MSPKLFLPKSTTTGKIKQSHVMYLLLLFMEFQNSGAKYVCHESLPCQHVDIGKLTGNFNDVIVQRKTRQVFVFSAIDHRNIDIVPHFIQHYEQFKVPRTHFLFSLHGTNRTARYDAAWRRLGSFGVSLVSWIGPFSAISALEHKIFLLHNVTDKDWVVYADVDEFAEFPAPLDTFINQLEQQRSNAVRGVEIDRISQSGELNKILSTPHISLQYPCVCNITKAMLRLMTDKIILLRGDFRAGTGNHRVLTLLWYKENNITLRQIDRFDPRYYAKIINLFHYKWTSEIIQALIDRVNYYRYGLKGIKFWQRSALFIDEITKNRRIDTKQYCTC